MAGGSGVSTARSAIVRWIGENSATSTAPVGSSPFGSSASQAPANAERTHVRPHPLDVVEAGVLGAPGSLGPTATRQRPVAEPDGVLLLVVQYDEVLASVHAFSHRRLRIGTGFVVAR